MLNYLIACRSLTYAQRAARTLERSGITAAVIRMPRELSATSCAYAVRIPERKLAAAQQTLMEARVPFGAIHPDRSGGERT